MTDKTKLFFAFPLMCAIGLSTLQPARAANGSITYTYDALGRVSTASYGTGVIVLYSYDKAGNPTTTSLNVNTATLTWTSTPAPPSCASNCWGGANWGILKWSRPPPTCTSNCWGAAVW